MTFWLADSIPEPHMEKLLDFVGEIVNPDTEAFALWGLSPFLIGQSLHQATNLADNLGASGPAFGKGRSCLPIKNARADSGNCPLGRAGGG